MDAVLKQLIHDRLDAGGADAAWVYQVLAACEGRDALDQQLGGAKPPKRSTRLSTAMPVAEPPERISGRSASKASGVSPHAAR